LPPYGPSAKTIPDGWGQGVHEGFVVEFQRLDGSVWTANFETAFRDVNDLMPHPNGNDVLVLARGSLWQVNPTTEERQRLSGDVCQLWSLGTTRVLCDVSGQSFLCVGSEGVVWATRTISMDGFQNIRIGENTLEGEAWSYADDAWHPFQVNLTDGHVTGGGRTY
jgi:hypothetical protein